MLVHSTPSFNKDISKVTDSKLTADRVGCQKNAISEKYL
jgi:hypothetical protein